MKTLDRATAVSAVSAALLFAAIATLVPLAEEGDHGALALADAAER